MDVSELAETRQHEIQHLLIVLDQLGRNFGLNRDVYYTPGLYQGYSDTFLLIVELQNDPLSWILCSTCVKMDLVHITEFISTLECYFIHYGHWDRFRHFTTYNGFSSLLSSSYWKLY